MIQLSKEEWKIITHRLNAADRLREALQLILPMAKGYAAAHPVGSNQKYVEEAEALAAKEASDEKSL